MSRWPVLTLQPLRALPSFLFSTLSYAMAHHGFSLEIAVPRFFPHFVKEAFAASRVVHQLTSAYHPQTNGLTECFNNTLSHMVSMYISKDHTHWHSIPSFLSFAYKTSIQSTTGFTPFLFCACSGCVLHNRYFLSLL
uniref:Putative transposon ty3-g gag-pol polyprotein n=1 Tax=Ixodes ricinus TaxID=34613 RepID=A0A6B0UT05_IXORI